MRIAFTASCLSLTVACTGGAAIFTQPDASSIDAATIPDEGVDANDPPGCTVDSDCVWSYSCAHDSVLFPTGYCSPNSCSPGQDPPCPGGTICNFSKGIGGHCSRVCDPDAATRECARGYACQLHGDLGYICEGGCVDDSDCSSGRACNREPVSGCYDPTAMPTLGTACTVDADCPIDAGFCAHYWGSPLPGGYCSERCSPDFPEVDCPPASACIALDAYGGCSRPCDPAALTHECRPRYRCTMTEDLRGEPVFACLPGCADDADCPAGHACDSSSGPTGACFDQHAAPGAPCDENTDCALGGRCYLEGGAGWPGGACVGVQAACDVDTNAGCAGGSCAPDPSSTGGGVICAAACATDADCRRAYECRAVPGVTGRSYCAPHCTSHADCTLSTLAGVHDCCDLASGLCVLQDPGAGACH